MFWYSSHAHACSCVGVCVGFFFFFSDAYDKDADGKLESDQCSRAMRACGIPLTVKEEQEITTDLDLYSDSEVNWDGFLALLEQHWKPIPSKQDLEAAFHKVQLQPPCMCVFVSPPPACLFLTLVNCFGGLVLF